MFKKNAEIYSYSHLFFLSRASLFKLRIMLRRREYSLRRLRPPSLFTFPIFHLFIESFDIFKFMNFSKIVWFFSSLPSYSKIARWNCTQGAIHMYICVGTLVSTDIFGRWQFKKPSNDRAVHCSCTHIELQIRSGAEEFRGVVKSRESPPFVPKFVCTEAIKLYLAENHSRLVLNPLVLNRYILS